MTTITTTPAPLSLADCFAVPSLARLAERLGKTAASQAEVRRTSGLTIADVFDVSRSATDRGGLRVRDIPYRAYAR